MDTALFLTLFLFAVQISAGVAPMIWPNPEHAWIARMIFWASGLFAVVCFVIWAQPMSFATPNYLIAIGLTAAACGFVWQQMKSPQPEPLVSTVLEKRAPASINKEPATIELRRKYIGQSKVLFDENLTQLSRILNGRGSEAVRLADKFLPLFTPGFASKMLDRYEPFNSNPQSVLKIMDEIHESIWGKLLRENRDQVPDLNDILADGSPIAVMQNRMRKTIQYFNAFKIVIEKGDEDVNWCCA
jgi:hypothetical protein